MLHNRFGVIAVLLLVVGVLWAGSVWADEKAPVPQTGQATCYDSTGNPLASCTGTGHDGEFQEGVELPTPRFTDNLNGTVTDNLTRLIWLKNANCINTDYPSYDNDFTAGDGQVNWQHALDFVAGINNGTYNCGDTSDKRGSHQTDWRLPNVREFFSLIYFAFQNPAISNAEGTGQGSSSDPFSNLEPRYYWSSTTDAASPSSANPYAWIVDFYYGAALNGYPKVLGHFVTAVRGGS